MTGQRSGRYSALEVAGWLDRLSADAAEHVVGMKEGLSYPPSAEAWRLVIDVGIQEAIGRFFAGKLRAAVWYELSTAPGGPSLLGEAVEAYRGARAALGEAAALAAGVYADDLTYGPQPWLRGTWSDRLPSIDRDLEALAALARTEGGPPDRADVERILEAGQRRLHATPSRTPRRRRSIRGSRSPSRSRSVVAVRATSQRFDSATGPSINRRPTTSW